MAESDVRKLLAPLTLRSDVPQDARDAIAEAIQGNAVEHGRMDLPGGGRNSGAHGAWHCLRRFGSRCRWPRRPQYEITRLNRCNRVGGGRCAGGFIGSVTRDARRIASFVWPDIAGASPPRLTSPMGIN